MNGFKKLAASCLLLFICAFAFPASAHKVVISAYADGGIIEGEIGFSNGDVASNAVVEVFDDAGNKIGETKTDEDGVFHYTPTEKAALNFKSNLGAGHIANYHMETDELPDNIGGNDAEKVAAAEVDDILANIEESTDGAGASNAAVGISPEALQKLIAAQVHEQLEAFKPEVQAAVWQKIKPLRKVMAEYMEKNDMQAILGGLGYICGLAGVGFYVAARMERKKQLGTPKENA